MQDFTHMYVRRALIYLIFIQISFHYSLQSLVVIPFIPHIEFMGYKNNKKKSPA